MKDCSIVTATYELAEGGTGTVGIIGPKRMDYENVVNSLKTLKVELDEVFKKNKSNQDSQLSDWKGGRKNVSETNKKEAAQILVRLLNDIWAQSFLSGSVV